MFWHRSVAGREPTDVDPIVSVPFRIRPADRIATVGSCFAQHISHALQDRGLQWLLTEPSPATAGAIDENYRVYPARFGNIYTPRQLLQLLQRAYGLFEPTDRAWLGDDGRHYDPFRPRIQAGGFDSYASLEADRQAHLLAVQRMFAECDVLIFTLGLTEGWESTTDGAVFPIPPPIIANDAAPNTFRFHNFTVPEMESDMRAFIELLRRVNPQVRVILTVSPVAMVATYEDRHVLVSNTWSKAALRVVAENIVQAYPRLAYFPSFEIVTGLHARSVFLAEDLREVSPDGVAHVMSIFCRHYLTTEEELVTSSPVVAQPVLTLAQMNDDAAALRERQRVICDEEVIATVV